MARQRFLLLHGVHIQRDLSQPPLTRFNDETQKVEQVVGIDRTTGRQYYEYPPRTYRAGEEMDSDIDLEARFGSEKFRRLDKPAQTRASYPKGSEPPEDDSSVAQQQCVANPAVNPGGQVTSGHQATTAGVPGPLSAEKVERFGLEEKKPSAASLTADVYAPASSGEKAELQRLAAQRADIEQKEAALGGDAKQGKQSGKTKQYRRKELEAMTVKDLKELAEQDEVDLGGATHKDDIIKKFHAT